jgi:hypothetical protein
VKRHGSGEVSLVELSYQVRTTVVLHFHEMPRLELGMNLGGVTGVKPIGFFLLVLSKKTLTRYTFFYNNYDYLFYYC